MKEDDHASGSGTATASDEAPPAAGESLIARARRILATGPKPGDCLRLPPDAAARVEREFELVQAMRPGRTLSDGERERVRADRTLQYHFGGQIVACMRTQVGVVVLAAGEEIPPLVETIPGSDWKGVVIEFPEPL